MKRAAPHAVRLVSLAPFALVFACSAVAPPAPPRGDAPRAEDPIPDDAPRSSDIAASPDASAPPPARGCDATSPRTTAVDVHVLPDEGEAPYVDLLTSAQKTIRVFAYQMGFGGVLDTLRAKAKAGVDVRVILDGETQRDVNTKYRTMLEGDGVKVAWSDPAFSYMHAKSIVVDDARALVSTGNYSRSYMLKERNFAASLVEPDDVADLAALFDADFSGTPNTLSCTRLLVSPENSRGRIEDLVRSAQKELLVESMQLADQGVRAAIADRVAAGVAVRVVLAAPSWIDTNTKAGAFLTGLGVGARWLGSPGIHVKAIVVDGERAYLGSENLSGTSLDKNREVGLVVSDAAAVSRMRDTFEADFARATPF